MGNDALAANGDTVDGYTADISITVRGSDAYWAIFAFMALMTLLFIAHCRTKPRTERVFHYITISITLVASIAYFAMASNLGWASILVEFFRGGKVEGTTREIFYVRYIDWVITTPLLLLDILLTAGMPWPTILFTLLLDEVMIITGLVGALVKSSYKWGFFTFGCVAFLLIVWNVAWVGRRHASALGSDVSKVYLITSVWTLGLWFLYPVAWGVAEGGNVISPDSEAAFYGTLDVLAKPIFGILFLWGHRNISADRLGLAIRDYQQVPRAALHEKGDPVPGARHGVHNGAGAEPAVVGGA
ncbi:hypothetical protein EsDP_00002829 [Epichloe bromicola]|uniref:Bacteriorhodopsin n=1 Tax=Epichloe bromicola TaxID=79588 RepID=A0ABQ0CLZ1_9HYPO